MFYSADTLRTQSPGTCLAAQSCPTLRHPMDCSPPGFSVHEESPGKNTGVGCHALLQGLFPTQGSNPGLPHCRWILYSLSHHEWTIYSISLSFTIHFSGKTFKNMRIHRQAHYSRATIPQQPLFQSATFSQEIFLKFCNWKTGSTIRKHTKKAF